MADISDSPEGAARLNALLDAQNPRTAKANDDLEAKVAANLPLMTAARIAYAAAKAALPVVAGAVGGPGAGAIATIAIGILAKVEN